MLERIGDMMIDVSAHEAKLIARVRRMRLSARVATYIMTRPTRFAIGLEALGAYHSFHIIALSTRERLGVRR